MYFMQRRDPADCPSKIVVTNRSTPRIEDMQRIHKQINPGIDIEYVHCPAPEDNDRVVNMLTDRAIVINATGLGKDAPGSPITDEAVFPQDGMAWEFNYRGDLLFLDQAGAQKQQRNLHVEDGWVYFIHGWTRVIAEVFGIDIPTSGATFDKLSDIAAAVR
jgi:shikimate 5-dehydrogenase